MTHSFTETALISPEMSFVLLCYRITKCCAHIFWEKGWKYKEVQEVNDG